MLIYWMMDGTTIQGDAAEIVRLRHLLMRQSAGAADATGAVGEPGAPDAARVTFPDGYVDVRLPADGATMSWVVAEALAKAPTHSDAGLYLLVDTEAGVVLQARSPVHAGRVYRLCAVSR